MEKEEMKYEQAVRELEETARNKNNKIKEIRQ